MRFKFTVLTILILCSLNLAAQDFNSMISSACDSLAKKIIASGKKKIAVVDFVNLNTSVTELGVFVCEEISSELANKTNNQTSFKVLERTRLEQILKERELLKYYNNGASMAKGMIHDADILIFATITEFEGYYRIVMKLLDTKDGDAISSFKMNLVKNHSLEGLDKNIVHQGRNNVDIVVTLTPKDSDGDGFTDDVDKCPNIYSKTNNGCKPEEVPNPQISGGRPSSSNESNDGNSQDSECATKKTGDFCFRNTSNKTILISFIEESGSSVYNTGSTKLTISIGESECLYNLEAINYKFGVFEHKVGVGYNQIQPQNLIKEGHILVETCKSKTYTIK